MSYLDVAGRRTWHQVDGDGPPVVLLHGAFSGASAWHAQRPALVEAGYQVFRPERRGHAHTPDVEGPLTYTVMAEDTIAYLAQVVGGPAHVVGWSDGAVVALLVAERRPELIERLVLVGQYYNFDGRVPGTALDEFLASEQAKTFLRAEYDAVSPDGPEHFETVYRKTMDMLASEPQIDLLRLRGVSVPTLVVQADQDEVTVEHSLDVVAALGRARLAVLPGTHGLPVESAELFNALLLWFLRGDPPAALPARRAADNLGA